MMEISLKNKSCQEIYNYKQVLEEIYDSLGMDANMNIYMCSQQKGAMTEDEIQQEVENFMDTMDAKIVKSYDLDKSYCVYGYSPQVDEYVYQNNDKVNVNIAFSYDEEDDITYIHRAVPFIDKAF